MFSRQERCYNGGPRHNFEPRYSEVPRRVRNAKVEIEYNAANLAGIRNFFTLKVYEKDVCTWCGKEIKKHE